MTSQVHSQISRLEKEIANLKISDAREAKKEADLLGKITRTQAAASSTRNTSTLQSKMRDLERFAKDMATVQKKRADTSKKISDKSRTLISYQDKQRREDEKARRKAMEEERKLMKEREAHQRRLRSQQSPYSLPPTINNIDEVPTQSYDFFVCHASEDKEIFVNELVNSLKDRGASIWYDEFALQIGNSLRRAIDIGLLRSRYGIVIISENFFKKEWPQRELDGLVALESKGGERILPIWYKITKDEVAALSPILADKVALKASSYSINEIVNKLLEKLSGQ